MSLLIILIISICVSAGVLLLISKELFRIVMGLAVLGVAANLILFLGGRPDSLVPAVIQAGNAVLPMDATNPLPQALVLTAIVIGFALICFALLLAAAVAHQQGHTNVTNYQDSEPLTAAKDVTDEPAIMETE